MVQGGNKMKNDENNNTKEQDLDQTQQLEPIEDTNNQSQSNLDQENIEPSKPLNKKLIIGLASVGSIFLLIGLIFGVSAFQKNQTIKQADSLISMEKFEDGIALYDQLLMKKYIPAIVSKRDLAIELMESEENLKKGTEAFDDDNKPKAIKHLSKIPKGDKKRYNKALEMLEELEESAVADIESLVGANSLDEASKMVTEYLRLYPDSVDIQNAEQDIISKRSEAENQAKAQEQAQKDKAAADAKAAQASVQSQANQAASNMKKEEARNVASYVIGTTRAITSKEANLRSSPTLNGDIHYTLSRGEKVYIQNTQIENSNRIWCYVRDQYSNYGWISYNTMNNSI